MSSTSTTWSSESNTKAGPATLDISTQTSGNLTIAGDLAITGGNITSALTCDSTLITTGLLTATAGIKLGNNIIYASDGGATITLDTSDNVTILGDLAVTGGDITSSSGAISFGNENLSTTGNLDVDGTTNLDAVDIDGNVQLDGTLTVGVDGTGKDVKFFGDDPGNFMLWDQSADNLEIRNDYAKAGLLLSNTDAGASNSPAISYYRNSASATASDILGITTYTGRNADNDADVIYARLQSSILDATKGGEEGQFKIGVMANGTFQQDSIILAGQSDGTVDVNIGIGAASVTTVVGDATLSAGNLTITGATKGIIHTNSGTVTQGTSITTGVTLSTTSGVITMYATAIAADENIEFTVTNTTVQADSVILLSMQDENTVDNTQLVCATHTIGSGSFKITVANTDSGQASSATAVKIHFLVINNS